jgi:hypothetical protein
VTDSLKAKKNYSNFIHIHGKKAKEPYIARKASDASMACLT